jgi:hypothetical protein
MAMLTRTARIAKQLIWKLTRIDSCIWEFIMNISSVSSVSASTYSSSSSSSTDIASLQKQLVVLQKQLSEELQSDDDEKTKAAKVKQLQAQIQLVEEQIQQKMTENAKKKTETQQGAASATTGDQYINNLEKDSASFSMSRSVETQS